MFKDAYKRALDNFSPREGLAEEIIKKHAEEKRLVKTPVLKKVPVYAASIAALFVISTAFIAYPTLLKNHNERRAIDRPPAQASQDKKENALPLETPAVESEYVYETNEKEEAAGVSLPQNATSEKADEKVVSQSEINQASDEFPALEARSLYDAQQPEVALSQNSQTGVSSEPANSEAEASNTKLTSEEGGDSEPLSKPRSGGGGGGSATVSGGGGSAVVVKSNSALSFDYSGIQKSGDKVLNSGFKNTELSECVTSEKAVLLAQNELLIEASFDSVYFDESCQVWMVVFSGAAPENSVQRVFLDTSGKTLLISFI